jgi:hypothetical protein
MESKKFSVTPNHVINTDIVAEVRFTPMGTSLDPSANPILKHAISSLTIKYKTGSTITLSGEEAEAAWESYRSTL